MNTDNSFCAMTTNLTPPSSDQIQRLFEKVSKELRKLDGDKNRLSRPSESVFYGAPSPVLSLHTSNRFSLGSATKPEVVGSSTTRSVRCSRSSGARSQRKSPDEQRALFGAWLIPEAVPDSVLSGNENGLRRRMSLLRMTDVDQPTSQDKYPSGTSAANEQSKVLLPTKSEKTKNETNVTRAPSPQRSPIQLGKRKGRDVDYSAPNFYEPNWTTEDVDRLVACVDKWIPTDGKYRKKLGNMYV